MDMTISIFRIPSAKYMLDKSFRANILEVHLQWRQWNTDVPRVLRLRTEPTIDMVVDERDQACCYDDTAEVISN